MNILDAIVEAARAMTFYEIWGTVFGVICVVLTIRRHIACWPTGIVQIVLFTVMFWRAHLYADVLTQIVFFVLSIYGWWAWLKGGEDKKPLVVTRLTPPLALLLALFAAAGIPLLALALIRWTDTPAFPYWDSAIAVGSFIAQWMLARKLLENWLVWIAVDVVSIGVYFAKQLYLASALYVVFLVLATMGWLAWKRLSRRGLVIGKFMPPHVGHMHLIAEAKKQAGALTVVVCSTPREPIPGVTRFAWMQELAAGARVVHLPDDLPQEPADHPDFWGLWTRALRQFGTFDAVFTSESYGDKLAECLSARHVSVDPARAKFPVSGTAIREMPAKHWDALPEIVRPYFVKRVVLYGPESTGKTTLAKRLAEHFHTTWAPEFARAYLDKKGLPVVASDIEAIARGQVEAEDAAARAANRVTFCDTELLTTRIYAEHYFGQCPAWIAREADARPYDLFLLLAPDLPWVPDPQRDLGDRRVEFYGRFKDRLVARNAPFVEITGSGEARFEACRRAVSALVDGKNPAPPR